MSDESLDVLVIDDSAVVREVMRKLLSAAVGVRAEFAANASLGLLKVKERRPNVILLDLTLPGMDGFEFLEHVMSTDPIPVVILSGTAPEGSNRALRAISLGAVELIEKPTLDVVEFLHESAELMVDTIQAAALVHVRKQGFGGFSECLLSGDALDAVRCATAPEPKRSDGVIAIGASTGGPQTLHAIFDRLSRDVPGVVVAQHMPAGFTRALAAQLDSTSPLTVREARDGDPILCGHVLISPGDRHIKVRGRPGNLYVALDESPHIKGHRPNIDVLFRSVAKRAPASSIGVILTGMGSDGADGLADMKRAGGRAVAQSEESSAVFGMPRRAIEMGVVDWILGLEEISELLADLTKAGRGLRSSSAARRRGRTS